MTIYNFYLFNKDGSCIYYKEWKREKKSGIDQKEEFKLMYGMILSLRSFSERLATKDGIQTVKFYRTSTYKMNFLETLTGLKMVLNTDSNALGIPELLRSIYQVFVDTVMRNPLLSTDSTITSELFDTRIDELVGRHVAFA